MTGDRRPASGGCTSKECEEFVQLLTEYWENHEDATLRREIEAHARICPECAEVFEAYSVTVSTFRSASKVREPGDVHKELWDRLARQLSAFREYLG